MCIAIEIEDAPEPRHDRRESRDVGRTNARAEGRLLRGRGGRPNDDGATCGANREGSRIRVCGDDLDAGNRAHRQKLEACAMVERRAERE